MTIEDTRSVFFTVTTTYLFCTKIEKHLTSIGRYDILVKYDTEQPSRVSTLTLRQTGWQVFIGQSSVLFCAYGSGRFEDKWIAVLSIFLAYYEEDKAISDLFINEQIRDKEVRVIGEDGEQLGIMPSREALRLAEEAGLDLVKIAPTAKPPVCKIVDYGKFRYEQARKEKEARKKQKIIEIKEIRLSPNIDTNDLNTKISAARKFITKGDKVKITLRFRGREMAHMANSKHILDDFAEALSDIASIEKAPKVEGRSMTMFLTEKR